MPARRFRSIAIPLASVALLALLAVPAQAAGGRPAPRSGEENAKLYAAGVELIEQGRYEDARRVFEKLTRRAPEDPDALNMLAYTQRKTGQLDRAIRTYGNALKRRSDFPKAREYLAEAYVQSALREYSTLVAGADTTAQERQQIRAAFEAAIAQIDSGQIEPQAIDANAGHEGKRNDRTDLTQEKTAKGADW